MGRLEPISGKDFSVLMLIFNFSSIFACVAVILTIYLDQRTKKSYHLQLVARLLLSNAGICVNFLVYILVHFLDNNIQAGFCNVFIPLHYFFVLSSYGWAVMLAFKFRRVHSSNKLTSSTKQTAPLKFIYVWLFAAVLTIPILIAGFVNGNTNCMHDRDHQYPWCTFNHNKPIGIVMDLVVVQAPLLAAILLNGYLYLRGKGGKGKGNGRNNNI